MSVLRNLSKVFSKVLCSRVFGHPWPISDVVTKTASDGRKLWKSYQYPVSATLKSHV